MRFDQIEVFKYEELSDEAKESAREWLRSVSYEFSWSEEYLDSIRTFCSEFGVSLTNWRIGPYSKVEFETDATHQNFRGRKLKEFKPEYTPTGFCGDYPLWSTFYNEFKRTGDAKYAFDRAIYEGFKEWRADWEESLSDESIEETIIANQYEFTKYGNRYI